MSEQATASTPNAAMPHSLTAADWAGPRGEKWSTQLSGMEATLASIDRPLFDALQLDGPCNIADLGCGGGGTSFSIAKRAAPGTTIHAFDVSATLIARARERAAEHPSAVTFQVANVATAAAPPLGYARLVSRFGTMFFDDPPAAFANLVPWLAPGGRFAFAVWGPSTENPWMTLARDVVAQFIELPSTQPEAPGAFRYAHVPTLLSLLNAAGFREVSSETWRGLLPLGGGLSASEAATFALASFASLSELLAAAGHDVYLTAHQALAQAYSAHLQGNVVMLGAQVHLVTGAR